MPSVIFLRGVGVGEPQMSRGQKGAPRHRRHELFFQQGLAEGAVVIEPSGGALEPQAASQVHQHVKGSPGLGEADVGHTPEAGHHEFPTGREGLVHAHHVGLGPLERPQRGPLGHGAGVGGEVSLELVHLGDEGFGAQGVADAPPRHGEGLAHPVHQQHPGGEVGEELQGVDVAGVAVDQAFVDLVPDDPQVMPFRQLPDAPQELFAVDLSRGVAGGVEQQAHGAGRDGLFQGLQGGKVPRGGRFHHHGFSLEEIYLLQVTYPGGGGDDHLVSGVHQASQGLVEQGLGPGSHQDLLGGVGEAETFLIVRRHGFFELGDARTGGIMGLALGHGLLGRRQGAGGRGEVGFPRPEGDDAFPLGRQGLGLACHGQGGGGFHAKGAMG